MVFNVTFNNITVILVEETGVARETLCLLLREISRIKGA